MIMSDLSLPNKAFLEEVFNMSGGYVLDFSNASFASFFAALDIDIYDSVKYPDFGESKANRMRAFWKSGTDFEVATALEELAEYIEAKKAGSLSWANELFSSINDAQITRIRDISQQLSKKIKLDNDTWIISEEIGSGGFGKVYRGTSGHGIIGAIKFIPKDKGAGRDLLAADLSGVENVIHIIDQGESETDWIVAMPLAEKTFRDFLDEHNGRIDIDDALKLGRDVATSLKGLNGKIVHRDIKPQNILLLDGNWRLSDFGISRYAEATTASDTQKFAMSPPYSAPERWESKRATTATDMYALGVVLYESIAGAHPFLGPDVEDYREQHMHHDAPSLADVPPAVASLIKECLYKTPGSRPSPDTFLNRLERNSTIVASGGLGALQQANQQQVESEMAAQLEATMNREELQSREQLADTARRELTNIAGNLKDAITAAAPTARVVSAGRYDVEWRLELGSATLDFNRIVEHAKEDWGDWESPSIDVIAYASLDVSMIVNSLGYEGRGHSLWYCDAQKRGEYGWYEVAFMISPLIPKSMLGSNGGVREPCQLNPSEGSAKALWRGMAEWQLARPFILLKDGAIDEFIDRWAGYLAVASSGSLNRPSTMPEMKTEGSWAY